MMASKAKVKVKVKVKFKVLQNVQKLLPNLQKYCQICKSIAESVKIIDKSAKIERDSANVSKLSGPTKNRTWITSLQDQCASHYTIGPLIVLRLFPHLPLITMFCYTFLGHFSNILSIFWSFLYGSFGSNTDINLWYCLSSFT